MKIQIESPRLEADEKLKELVQTKFAYLCKRYYSIHSCGIVLRKERGSGEKQFFVESKVASSAARLFASDRAESFDAAIEQVVKKLDQQLRHIKMEREEIW